MILSSPLQNSSSLSKDQSTELPSKPVGDRTYICVEHVDEFFLHDFSAMNFNISERQKQINGLQIIRNVH